jgi:pyruvate dehydrogenase E2 component (dihydrolipoamide acetyltransferase)
VAELTEVRVPDIGDFENVDVVEVFVQPGAHVEAEQSLITIESEKASLEIPAPSAGTVRDVKVAVGDKVSEGTVIVTLEIDAGGAKAAAKAADTKPPREKAPAGDEAPPGEKPAPAQKAPAAEKAPPPENAPREEEAPAHKQTKEPAADLEAASETADPEPPPHPRPAPVTPTAQTGPRPPHASPSVRRFARELGTDLSKISGSGPKGRVLGSDVQDYVKAHLAQPAAGSSGLPPLPKVDFAKFGEVEVVPLSKINKLTARNVHRSWLHIPHVNQFDEADITDLEEFRKASQKETEAKGFKLTFLAFLLKACAGTLREFPRFNSSLDDSGEQLVLKKYINIGVAVDTPEGLLVPVIFEIDSKGIFELAEELADVSTRARAGKLTPKEIQGATFSISSLGGIGGTAFTPIINAPEVAILGVSRAVTRPVYRDGELVPRLILPLCLSYDHRVIDGAAGARFTTHLASLLGDIRRLAL